MCVCVCVCVYIYSHTRISFSHKQGTKQWYMLWCGWNLDKPWKQAKWEQSVFCGLYCIIPFTGNVHRQYAISTGNVQWANSQSEGRLGLLRAGGGWGGEWLLMGFLIGVMRMVWVLVVRVVQLCEYSKNYRTLFFKRVNFLEFKMLRTVSTSCSLWVLRRCHWKALLTTYLLSCSHANTTQSWCCIYLVHPSSLVFLSSWKYLFTSSAVNYCSENFGFAT